MSSATSELLLSDYHIQPITDLGAMDTTDHLTLLQLFFLHCFPRKEKIRKIFCECKFNNDQILSIKSSFTPDIGIFRCVLASLHVYEGLSIRPSVHPYVRPYVR